MKYSYTQPTASTLNSEKKDIFSFLLFFHLSPADDIFLFFFFSSKKLFSQKCANVSSHNGEFYFESRSEKVGRGLGLEHIFPSGVRCERCTSGIPLLHRGARVFQKLFDADFEMRTGNAIFALQSCRVAYTHTRVSAFNWRWNNFTYLYRFPV